MSELNKLTLRLLAEGYTKENPPDFVREWSDFDGGWEYGRSYQNKMVFKTGCGLLVKGSRWRSGTMYYMGIDWRLENDNPVTRCPYSETECQLNHPSLRGRETFGYLVHCRCRETQEEYEYEKSIDKVFDDIAAEERRLFEEFKVRKHGRVCQRSSHFNERTKEWEQHFDPINVCSKYNCKYCVILGRELNRKKGNVFYDVKVTRADTEKGLFNKGDIVTVTKGKRFLDKNVSIDICEMIVKKFSEAIWKKYEMRHYSELFFAKYHGVKYDFEILNIRAETRVSRDLEQDLEDIQNGFEILHESDLIEGQKQFKRERKQKALEQRVKRMKKLLSAEGFENLNTTERIRAEKMLDKGLISQDDLKKKPAVIHEQLSLF